MSSNKPSNISFIKPDIKAPQIKNPQPLQNNSGMSIIFYITILLLSGFIILLLVFLVQYLKQPCGSAGKMDYWSYLKSFNPTLTPCNPDLPEKEYEEREIKQEKEVFHINDQVYTYPEAFEKCKAYGAELASYQQLVDAYNNNASWPSYGWSKGQNAFYPIQPCDYVKMRRRGINVGPPGVNGGKFKPYLRFGANCFGIKPAGHVSIPKDPICEEDGETEICRNNPEACKILDSDRIDPFSWRKKWSQWGEDEPKS